MGADPIRVQTVFLGAVNLADADARKAFLDQACGGDSELRGRVEALLRAHDAPDSLLDEPIVPPTGDTAPSHEGADAIDASLSFLGPPQRPGSLGRIGHYEVLEVLGRGGFGVVFRAFDEALQRVVAVKVLAPHIAATSPARKRFLREARAAAQVRHENVVQVHAVVEEPLPYLVMEYIPGETLQQRMDRTGPLDAAEVVSIGRQIAAGLAAAHEKGLIHRDIKPTNILVDGGSGRRVTITDFGLARAADDASLTKSGILAGTPMFMAPEQAKGDALDARADLFSLGSVLYTMASGRPPFRASGTMAVLRRVCDEEPRPIKEVIPEAPEWLCRIIDKLHAKDPAQRFQSAPAIESVLADCEKQLAATAEVKDFRRIPPKARRTKPAGRYELRDYSRIPSRPSRLWNPSAWASFLAAVIVIGAGLFVVARSKMEALRAVEAEHRARLYEDQARAQQAAEASRAAVSQMKPEGSAPEITPEIIKRLRDNADGLQKSFNTIDAAVKRGEASQHELDDAKRKLFNSKANLADAEQNFGERNQYLQIVVDCLEKRRAELKEFVDSGKGGKSDLQGIEGQIASAKSKLRETAAINQEVVQALRDKASTLEKRFNTIEAAVKSGTAPQTEALEARIGWLEAVADVAEAKKDFGARNRCLTLVVNRRQEQRAILKQMFDAGKVPQAELNEIDVKIADAKARLAAANPAAATPKTGVDQDVVKALRAKAEAKKKQLQIIAKNFEAKAASKMELIEAEVENTEARIVLAEAERLPAVRVQALEELVKHRQEEKGLIEKQIAAKAVPPSALHEIDAMLADAKARLAIAKAEAR